jgi:hypothetical protein
MYVSAYLQNFYQLQRCPTYLYGRPACIVGIVELVCIIGQDVQPAHFAFKQRALCMSNCIPATSEHFLSVNISNTCGFQGVAWKYNGELALQTQIAFDACHMVFKHDGQGPG